MYAISVLDILEETTKKHPDRKAVIDEKESFTYEMLLNQAQILGYALSDILQGVVQRPIALFMEKSCKCIAAMLGILYSGNIYVPTDTKIPLDRMYSILDILESDIVFSSVSDKALLDKIDYQGKVLLYEELEEKYQNVVDDTLLKRIRASIIDTNLMYILFTSGSTGTPKGVAVMHRSVMDYIKALEEKINFTSDDIVGNQAPFYADMSLRDIYMPIKAGVTNCIIPQKYFISPKTLLKYLDEKRVTFLMWVPTAYRIVAQFDALSKVRPAYLRKIWFSGETMPIQIFRYWKNFYPEAEYAQLYGPTEITGACTFYNVMRDYGDEEVIPIGRPLRNTGIVLLDENNREIANDKVNEPGEICVFGSCLAAGYYNNRKETKEAFIQNPLIGAYNSRIYRTGDLAKWDRDGNLIFVSRKDYQIKHAGKRVELGEIESAFQSVEEIKACCCVQDRKKDSLVLFYIGELEAGQIMRKLQSKLPKYMIPQVFRKEKQLPMLPNGKLDKKQMDRWINEQ